MRIAADGAPMPSSMVLESCLLYLKNSQTVYPLLDLADHTPFNGKRKKKSMSSTAFWSPCLSAEL